MITNEKRQKYKTFLSLVNQIKKQKQKTYKLIMNQLNKKHKNILIITLKDQKQIFLITKDLEQNKNNFFL